MAFYDLPKPERVLLVTAIHNNIKLELEQSRSGKIRTYFNDEDTYIRKTAYLETGRIFYSNPKLQTIILATLKLLLPEQDFKIRQTAVNAAGEIGKREFERVRYFFDTGLFDTHHAVRNAVIGSVKKMGDVNPEPVLNWAKGYLHHEDKEIRREICHGIELRGRRYPQDILPMLQELQHDKTARVRKTLVHVIGQIAYKKGCLQTVVAHLKTWENKQLVADALEEIIDVHDRYKNFSVFTQASARQYIEQHYP